MRWTERQRAMLAEMGVRPWFRVDGDVPALAPESPPSPADLPAPASAAVAAGPVAHAPTASDADAPAVARPAAAGSHVQAAATPAAAQAEAGWLVVGGPPEAGDDPGHAGAEAEQAQLLVHMLRAIGVSAQAEAPAMRASLVRAGTPAMADLQRLPPGAGPRCILVLGRPAAMALLGVDEPLGRLRGRVHVWRGVPVVVTFPLAYLLRNPGEKAKAWADLCLAATAHEAPATAQ